MPDNTTLIVIGILLVCLGFLRFGNRLRRPRRRREHFTFVEIAAMLAHEAELESQQTTPLSVDELSKQREEAIEHLLNFQSVTVIGQRDIIQFRLKVTGADFNKDYADARLHEVENEVGGVIAYVNEWS